MGHAQNFNPFSYVYTGAERFLAIKDQDPVGHKILNSGIPNQYGTIKSHPAISLFHEAGGSEELGAWAEVNNQLVYANGERPVRVQDMDARWAGVLPPTTKPTLSLERTPLYERNQETSGGDPEDDPVEAETAADLPLYHLRNRGNNYIEVPYHSESAWEDADDWIAFKGWVKFNNTDGRQMIFCNKSGLSTASGYFFIDSLNGVCRVGWYDTHLAKEVWVETSQPVFIPGFWHYLYVRKRHPDPTYTPLYSNWHDSVYAGAVGVSMRDSLVVRLMPKEAPAAPFADLPTWFSTGNLATIGANSKAGRMFVSFTTRRTRPAGTVASGFVTARTDGEYSSVAGAGNENMVRSGTVSAGEQFAEDMIGMIWQWGTGAPASLVAKSYRVTEVLGGGTNAYTDIKVVDAVTGAVPDFHAAGPIVGQPGGVFTGVELVRSSGYAEAEHPDHATNNLFINGHPLAIDPASGVARSDMVLDSPALAFGNGTADVDLFEDGDNLVGPVVDIAIGTDNPAGHIFSTTKPGQLQVDTGGFCFWSSGTRQYGGASQASAIPNESLDVAKSAESSTNASAGTWKYIETLSVTTGKRKLRVAFYDPAQAEISNPGPDVEFTPPQDSKTNPSGFLGIVLSDLPIAREPGNIERWIYMTVSGGEGNYFRVAKIQDNTSTSIAISTYEKKVKRGIVLEFDNQAPPRCLVVEAHGGVVAYGNLRRLVSSDQGTPVDLPDGVVYSKSARPFAVPYTNFFQMASGQGDEVRGMRDMNGVLIIGKKQSAFRAILRQFAPQFELISRDTGILSHQSMVVVGNRLYAHGDRGVYVYPAGGMLTWVSENLETFFTNDETEVSWGKRVTAALNPTRSQYVMAIRKAGETLTTHRVSTEFDDEFSGAALQKMPAAHRWSHYEGFPITTLGIVQDPSGRVQRLLGGTEYGHVLWMDDRRTRFNSIGPTSAIWGSPSYAVAAGSQTDEIVVSDVGDMDSELDGMRGSMLRWGADDAYSAMVLVVNPSSPRSFLLDRVVEPAAVPASGTTVRVGNPQMYWESKWFDFGDSWANKKALYLDVVFRSETSGTVTVLGYEDGDMATERALGTIQLDGSGSDGFIQASIPTPMFGRHLKVRFESYDQFEITEMVFRMDDVEQD